MSRFLSVIPVEKARETIRTLAKKKPFESVPLHLAYGRILATDISSDIDVPGFNRSTVDGYAVISSDTIGAGDAIPSMLTQTGSINVGQAPEDRVKSGTCMYIPTGAALPPGADAVVMIEYCEQMEDQVLISRPVSSGENVVLRGEDFSTSRIAVTAGTRITSRVAGVLAACGLSVVQVYEKPVIGIISTGNELVPINEVPSGGEIRDVNTYLCAGFVEESGGLSQMFGITRDDRESLSKILDKALKECDAVLISGGSSKGEKDICAEIIASRGEVLVHGISISPGKPTIIGVADEKPVIGLPGHPASAYVVLHVIVSELMNAMTGQKRSDTRIYATLKSPVSSAQGREDYIRARYEGSIAEPVFGKSGLINTLLESDGMIRIPAQAEGYEAGDIVEILRW
jgi:molybdopterin molybdotransferase